MPRVDRGTKQPSAGTACVRPSMISPGVAMHFSIRFISVSVLTILLLAACGKKAAEPAPLAAQVHPTLTLDAKAGRVLVPQSAVVERGGIPGVFVLGETAQARFRMVRTGKNVDGRVEILSGLGGSETLVTGDLRDVHDGSPIQREPVNSGKL
jgi:hypothetical protein